MGKRTRFSFTASISKTIKRSVNKDLVSRFIQDRRELAAFIKLLQHIAELIDIKADLFLRFDLRNFFNGELVKGVKIQRSLFGEELKKVGADHMDMTSRSTGLKIPIGPFPGKPISVPRKSFFSMLYSCSADLEGVHRDRLLIGIGDVFPLIIRTKAGIGMAGIDNDHIHIIKLVLLDQRIHKKGLARTAGTQHKFVAVIDPVRAHRQVRRVDADRYALPVGKADQEIRGLIHRHRFLKEKTKRRIAGGQEPVIILQFDRIAGQRRAEQFQLVVGIFGRNNTQTKQRAFDEIRCFLDMLLSRSDHDIKVAVYQ
jgi:hypothetical protein